MRCSNNGMQYHITMILQNVIISSFSEEDYQENTLMERNLQNRDTHFGAKDFPAMQLKKEIGLL